MTRLYRQDPTRPDLPEEQRDQQRLEEMWPEFEKLAKAQFALEQAAEEFERVSDGGEIYVEDSIADAVAAFIRVWASDLECRDPVELVEQFYQDVYRTVNDPKSRIKEALKRIQCARCTETAITELDGDQLCKTHADAWVRAEGQFHQETQDQ